LSDLETIDSILAVEDGSVEARKLLKPVEGIYGDKEQIKNLLKSQNNIDALISIIKVDYKIADDEIEKPKEVLVLEQLLKEKERELELKNQTLGQKQTDLSEAQKRIIELLESRVAPQKEQKPEETHVKFREIDLYEVERTVDELSDIILQAVEIKDGRLDLKVPTVQIGRKYNELKEELRNSQYEPLYEDAVFIFKNLEMPMFRDDPSSLYDIILNNINNIRMTVGLQQKKMEREEKLKRFM
jgi:hypothetical protein